MSDLLFHVGQEYVVRFDGDTISVQQVYCGNSVTRVYEDEKSLVLRIDAFKLPIGDTVTPSQLVWFRKIGREYGAIRCKPREVVRLMGQPMVLDMRRRASQERER